VWICIRYLRSGSSIFKPDPESEAQRMPRFTENK
jgi:hypothetical protein